MDSLHKNKTWKSVKRPEDHKLIDCKCVYKIKEGEVGKDNVKYKLHLLPKVSYKKMV